MLVVLFLLVVAVAVALAMVAETAVAAAAAGLAAVEATMGQRSAFLRALSRMACCRRLRSLRRPCRPRHPCRPRCRETFLWTWPIPLHRGHPLHLQTGDSRQADQGCSYPAAPARLCGSRSNRSNKNSNHYHSNNTTSDNNRHNRGSCRSNQNRLRHLLRLRPRRGRWANLRPPPRPPRQPPECRVSCFCLLARRLPQRLWWGAWRRPAAAVRGAALPATGAHRRGCPPTPPPQGWAQMAAGITPLVIAPPARVAVLPMGGPAPGQPVRTVWAAQNRCRTAEAPPPAAVTAASGRGHPSARAPTPPRLRRTPRWPRLGRRR